MSYTKNYHIICDGCCKFCVPFDEETPYGQSSYDPPEPLDPYHYCKKCSKALYKEWLEKLSMSHKYGSWIKSKAEIKAAKKLGLRWDSSNFIYVEA